MPRQRLRVCVNRAGWTTQPPGERLQVGGSDGASQCQQRAEKPAWMRVEPGKRRLDIHRIRQNRRQPFARLGLCEIGADYATRQRKQVTRRQTRQLARERHIRGGWRPPLGTPRLTGANGWLRRWARRLARRGG